MCRNDEYKAEYQMCVKEYNEYIQANADPMASNPPALTCDKCNESSIFRAEKYTNTTCGKVFM
ncbi:MAG: hypothetical protein ACFE7I_09805 [Candidatus Hodarchaeota archaeon]